MGGLQGRGPFTRTTGRERDHVMEQAIEVNRPTYAAALPISSRKYVMRERRR